MNAAALRVLQLPVPMRLCVAEDPQLPRTGLSSFSVIRRPGTRDTLQRFCVVHHRRLAVACRSGSEVILPVSINARRVALHVLVSAECHALCLSPVARLELPGNRIASLVRRLDPGAMT